MLRPLDEEAIMATPIDVTSIMAYQLPGSIMKDGVAVPGGDVLTASDREFCHRLYPK